MQLATHDQAEQPGKAQRPYDRLRARLAPADGARLDIRRGENPTGAAQVEHELSEQYERMVAHSPPRHLRCGAGQVRSLAAVSEQIGKRGYQLTKRRQSPRHEGF